MNLFALAVMLSLVAGFAAALLIALSTGAAWGVAVLAIVTTALFVRWR